MALQKTTRFETNQITIYYRSRKTKSIYPTIFFISKNIFIIFMIHQTINKILSIDRPYHHIYTMRSSKLCDHMIDLIHFI